MNQRLVRRALPLVILLGGFALRLFRLGADSLWYDETVSVFLARSDLAELTRHTAGDIHPPLYYYVLHLWGQFTGWSEFAAAFLSFFFGVLLIALVYRAARDWFNPPVALFAALLVALSPYNVQYSQEVRMYTLGASLGLLSVYFLLRMLRAERRFSRDFWAYVIITVLGIYTLYYFIFLIAFEYLFVAYCLSDPERPRGMFRSSSFIPHAKRSSFVTFLFSQLALALLYLPWLPIAFRQATDPPVPPWRSFVSLPDELLQTFTALMLGQSVEPSRVVVLPILFLGLLTFILSQRLRLANFNRRSPFAGWSLTSAKVFLFAYTFVPLLAIFLFSLWVPLYHVRYMFTYSPAFYMLLALALYALVHAAREEPSRFVLARRVVAGAALLLLVVGSLYSLRNFWFDPRYADDDLRGAVGRIAEQWRPGDAILVNAGYAYPALLYYFPEPIARRERLVAADDPPPTDAPVVLETGSINGSPRLGWGDPQSDFYATTAEETRAALDRVFREYPRVWMLRIYDTVTDPDGVIRQYFAEHGQLIEDQVFAGESSARVQGYLTQRLTALPASATALDARLANRVTLLGFERGPAQRKPGEFYDAVLYWKPLQLLNYNYQLSFQLLDSGGKLAAQHDETPLGETLPTTRWRVGEIYREPVRLQIRPDTAPGDYTAIVKLYNLRDGEVLGEPIQLGHVHITP